MIEILFFFFGTLAGALALSMTRPSELERLRLENAMLKTALQRKENVNY